MKDRGCTMRYLSTIQKLSNAYLEVISSRFSRISDLELKISTCLKFVSIISHGAICILHRSSFSGPVKPNSYIQVPDTKPFQQNNGFDSSYVQREPPHVILDDTSERNMAEVSSCYLYYSFTGFCMHFLPCNILFLFFSVKQNYERSSSKKKPKIRKRDSDAGPSTSEAFQQGLFIFPLVFNCI